MLCDVGRAGRRYGGLWQASIFAHRHDDVTEQENAPHILLNGKGLTGNGDWINGSAYSNSTSRFFSVLAVSLHSR